MNEELLIAEDKAPTSNQQTLVSQPSNQERTYAMLCHLSGLACYVLPVFGALIGPLVAWMVVKDRSGFADDQGKEALNFQLTLSLVVFVAIMACIFTLGLGAFVLWPIFVVVPFVQAIFVVLAAIAANNGERHRYPFNIRFLQ